MRTFARYVVYTCPRSGGDAVIRGRYVDSNQAKNVAWSLADADTQAWVHDDVIVVARPGFYYEEAVVYTAP